MGKKTKETIQGKTVKPLNMMCEPQGNEHFNYSNIITHFMYNGSGKLSNW